MNVFAVSPSIGKLLLVVVIQCLPQTVNYTIITTNLHEAYTFQDYVMTLVTIFEEKNLYAKSAHTFKGLVLHWSRQYMKLLDILFSVCSKLQKTKLIIKLPPFA